MAQTGAKETLLVKNVIVSFTDNPRYPDYTTFRLRRGSNGYFLSFKLAAGPNLTGITVHDNRFYVVDAFRTLIRQPFDPERLPVRLHQAVYRVRQVINSTAQIRLRKHVETGEYFITLYMIRGQCDGLVHYEFGGSDYQGNALLVDKTHPYLLVTDSEHRAVVRGERDGILQKILVGEEKRMYLPEDIDSLLSANFLQNGVYPTQEVIERRKRANLSSRLAQEVF